MVKDEKLISRLGKPCYTCDDTGVATPEAREQVLDRTSQFFPPELLNLNRLDSGSYLANSTRIHPPSSFSALKTSHIVLDVDSATNELLACQCYSELHGACAIACVVHTNVLFPLAQDLLRMTIRYIVICSVCFDIDLIPVLNYY